MSWGIPWARGFRPFSAFARRIETSHREARGLAAAFRAILRRACAGVALDAREEDRLRELGSRIREVDEAPPGRGDASM